MKPNIEQQTPSHHWNSVLHVGAGPYLDEDFYRNIAADRVVLVDADPEAVENLRTSQLPSRFEIRQALVLNKAGHQTFRRYTFAALNGLFGLGGASELYPRTRELAAISMESLAFSHLVAELGVKSSKNNLLILDAPGLVSELLADSPQFEDFSWIMLKDGPAHCLDGVESQEKEIQLLQKHGYSLAEIGSFANDQTIKFLFRDAQRLEIEALLKERDALTKTVSEVETALVATKKELEVAKAQSGENEKKRAEVAGQLEARTKERDALAAERDQLKKTAGDRGARIAELEAQVADQAERQKQIDEQMIRAETQLEMLKEFLQPSFK